MLTASWGRAIVVASIRFAKPATASLLVFLFIISPLAPVLADEEAPITETPVVTETPVEPEIQVDTTELQQQFSPDPETSQIDAGNDDPIPMDVSLDPSISEADAKIALASPKSDEERDWIDTLLLNEAEAAKSNQAESLTSIADNKWLNSYSDSVRFPQASPVSGAFVYSLPIITPPGRNGVEPQLQLSYNSQNKDGSNLFGLGWSINIPYIERMNKDGADKLYSESYFVSSMDGELATTTGTTTIYGAKFESGAFRQYSLPTATSSWTVLGKDGTQYVYGASTTAKIASSTSAAATFRWMLESVTDANGNAMQYEYTKSGGQVYPSKISYTSNGTSTAPFEVSFVTENRTEAIPSYEHGFLVNTTLRISEIRIKINGTLSRKYVLAYTTGHNGVRSLLESVTETGYDEASTATTLPPVKFTYQGIDISWPSSSPANTPPTLVDASGNDLGYRVLPHAPDMGSSFIRSAPSSKTRYQVPDWDSSTLSGSTPSLVNNDNTDIGSAMADVNGDGLIDIILGKVGSYQDVYLRNSTGYASASTTMTSNLPYLVDADGNDYGIRFGDFNGDGYADYIRGREGDTHRVYLNNADGTGWDAGTDYIFGYIDFADSSGNDTGARVVDINGDGLDDVIRRDNDDSFGQIMINMVDGVQWSTQTDSSFPVLTAAGGGDIGTRLADINGDGLIDIIISTPTRGIEFYINMGDGIYFNNLPINAIPYFMDYNETKDYGTRIMDGNDDGIPDFVTSTSTSKLNYLSSGSPVDVMTSVVTPQGATTTVTYKGARVKTILMRVVDTVSTDPGFGIAPVTRSYTFTDGDFQTTYQNRKFAGFGNVTTIDGGVSRTTTLYHQGNGNNYYGSAAIGEYNDTEAKMYRPWQIRKSTVGISNYTDYTINRWDSIDLGNGRTFPYLRNSITLNYDGTTIHRESAASFAYSTTTGNLTQKTEWGEVTSGVDGGSGGPNGNFTDSGTDKRTTDYTYASSSATSSHPYLFNLLASETLTDYASTKIAESRTYYDNVGLGNATIGNPTKQEFWKTASSYASTTSVYNSYGLVTSSKDGKANNSTFTYDSLNLYVSTSTNPLSQVIGYLYDYSLGKPKQVTDPNGLVFQTVYDGLDRVTQEKVPDQTTPATLVVKTQNTYTNVPLATSILKRNYLSGSITNDNYQYYDGLGRTIQTRTQADGLNTYAIKDQSYDARGQLYQESVPYFSSSTVRTTATTSNAVYTTYTYDGLGRATYVANAVGTTSNSYLNWRTTTTDPLSKTKDFYKDAFGNLESVVEHIGATAATTTYAWSAKANLTKITDALGNIRNFVFDGIGRRTSAEDLHASADTLFGTSTYAYDDAGNMTQQLDPKNQTTNYTYDALNRMTTEDYTGQAGTEITNTYDSCTYGIGRICTASTTAVKTAYTYSPHGLAASEIDTISGTPYTTSFIYDRQGNQATTTYPDGALVQYFYNSGNLVESIQKRESGGSYTNVVTNFDYAPTGQPTVIQEANGALTVNTYNQNALHRLTSKVTTLANNFHAQDLAYAYDANGNISQIVDTSYAGTPKTITYTYDDLNRMLTASTSGATTTANYKQIYTYNVLGNILTNGLGTYSYTGDTGSSYANPHALTSIATTTSNGGTSTSTIALAATSTSITTGLDYGPTVKTWTHASTAAGSLIVLTADIWQDVGGTGTITSATWGGDSFTKAGSALSGGMSSEMWYLIASSTGSKTISVTVTGANRALKYVAASYTGVTQTSPLDSISYASSTSDYNPDPSASLTTSTSGDLVTATLSRFFTTDATTTRTSLYKDNVTSILGAASYQIATSSGTYSDTYVGGAYRDWSMVIAAFKAATTSSTTNVTTTLGYDQSGNLTGDGTYAYTWDWRNRMTQSATGTATSTYLYDYKDSRAKVVEGGLNTFSPNKLYTNTTGTATTTTKHIFANGMEIAAIESSGTGVSTSTIAFDATSTSITTGFSAGPTTKTWTHTSTSTSNRLLVLAADIWQDVAGTGTITSATYGGVSLTKALATRSFGMACELWYLPNPASGANTMSVTVTGAERSLKMGAVTYTGAAQTSSLEATSTSAGDSSSNNNPSVSLSIGNAGDVMNATLSRFFTTDATTSQTSLFKDAVTSTLGAASYVISTTTGTYTDTYTGGAFRDWCMGAAAFKPATTTSNATTTTRYLHTDHLGGTQFVSDATGAVIEAIDYYPYGQNRVDTKVGTYTGEKRKYIGEEFDASTNLSYLNARYYNGARGNFLSEDPVFVGTNQNLGDPQTLNSYSYANGNPVNLKDPSGENGVLLALAVTAAAYIPAFVSILQGLSSPLGQVAASEFSDSVQKGNTPNIIFAAANIATGGESSSVTRISPQLLGKAGEMGSGVVTDGKKIIEINGRVRIPDSLKNAVTEVKNVSTQALTQQLKDNIDYAKSIGQQAALYLREGAKMTQPLQNAIKSGSMIGVSITKNAITDAMKILTGK